MKHLLLIIGLALVLAGTRAAPLVDPPTAEAAFPGVNGKIAFTKVLPGNYEIYTMNPDGSEQKNITNNPGVDYNGSWSADGTRMVFTSSRAGVGGIYVMRADGTDVQLVTTPSYAVYPSFSPDGTRVAFQGQEPTGSFGIFVVNVDGSGLVRITPQGVDAFYPSWSPDGAQIAFGGQGADDVESLFVVNANGSNLHALGNAGFQSIYADWSPDGARIAYHGVSVADASSAGIYVFDLIAGANQRLTNASGFEPAWSPDGTKIAFSTGNVQTQTFRIAVMDADGSKPMDITPGPSDSSPHWAPALPVVFIHGFAGSRINCGANEMWPNIPPGPPFADMLLASDGISDAAGGCASPSVGDTLDTVLGTSIYKDAIDYLNQYAPGNVFFFNWDWRTGEEQALVALDEFIDDVIAGGGGPKVVIMAHSYGGLLARHYVDHAARADKVARVLTVGTPAWGSPKALLPLYAGVELPDFSSLDLFIDNDDFKEFAKNALGNYFLYPSAPYGPWLTLQPSSTALDRQGVLDYVAQLGGNEALLASALDTHASVLDSLPPSGVDLEVIVGAGLPTITSISVVPGGYLWIEYGNGDGTVPARSAARGVTGPGNPNADHTHYSCGVGHVALPGDPQITDAIGDFLRTGDPIDGLPDTACPASGNQFRLFSLAALPAGPAARGLTGGGAPAAVTPEEADLAGEVDYLDLPNEKFIITGTSFPDLLLPAGRFLEVTPISDGTKGAPILYGPLEGQISVSSDADGPAVFVDGEPVEPAVVVAGDINCSGAVDSVDGLGIARFVAGLAVGQTQPCPDIGSAAIFGDVNCSGGVDAVDSLFVLRHVAGLPVNLPPGCREIGT